MPGSGDLRRDRRGHQHLSANVPDSEEMAVFHSGKHESPAGVNEAGPRPSQLFDGFGFSRGDDPVSANRDLLRPGIIRIDRVHLRMGDMRSAGGSRAAAGRRNVAKRKKTAQPKRPPRTTILDSDSTRAP